MGMMKVFGKGSSVGFPHSVSRFCGDILYILDRDIEKFIKSLENVDEIQFGWNKDKESSDQTYILAVCVKGDGQQFSLTLKVSAEEGLTVTECEYHPIFEQSLYTAGKVIRSFMNEQGIECLSAHTHVAREFLHLMKNAVVKVNTYK